VLRAFLSHSVSNDQPVLNFAWELMWSEPTFTHWKWNEWLPAMLSPVAVWRLYSVCFSFHWPYTKLQTNIFLPVFFNYLYLGLTSHSVTCSDVVFIFNYAFPIMQGPYFFFSSSLSLFFQSCRCLFSFISVLTGLWAGVNLRVWCEAKLNNMLGD